MPDPEPKRCLGCGYVLDHLTESRCPECGRGFDPEEPRTYCAPGRGGHALVIAAVVGTLATALPIAFEVAHELPWPEDIHITQFWQALIGVVGVAGVICSLLSIGRALDHLRRRHWIALERRRIRRALLISTIAVCLFLSSCPWSRGSDGSLHYGPFILRAGNGSNR